MMINIHLFEYLSFCWFGEISTVSSVSTVYTVVLLWNQTLKWTNTTINWIYFISLEWIMCAKFTRVSRIATNSPMYTHETMKSAFHNSAQKPKYWLYLLHLAVSFRSLHIISTFLSFWRSCICNTIFCMEFDISGIIFQFQI